MIPSFGVQLFWMIAIGITIGYASYYLFLNYSIRLSLSLAFGTFGAVLTGMIALFFEFVLPLMYAVLGAVTFLFIANAFLTQVEE